MPNPSDSLSKHYHQLWEPGLQPPELKDFLEQHPQADHAERREVILADFRLRWKTRRPVTAEKYLEAWPELQGDETTQIELIAAEFYFRSQLGETISESEIAKRFPERAEPVLKRMIELQQTVDPPRRKGLDLGKTGTLDVSLPSHGSLPTQTPSQVTLDLPPPVLMSGKNTAVPSPRQPSNRAQMKGQTVGGRYVLLEHLGGGGFGQVFLAQDLRFAAHDGAAKVAIKLMDSGMANDREIRKEALLMRQFKHPHVAEVYDYGVEEDGLPWMVMEYLPGETVDHWRKQFDGPVPVDKLIRFVEQTASALQSAHNRNLVHHDLKPHNIMVLDAGKPEEIFKLLDFGISAKIDSENTLANHDARQSFTPYYVAPEIMRGEELSCRSDIYTFGVILYELLTGTFPWQRKPSIHAHYHQVLNEAPRKFSEVAPQIKVPAKLEALVMQCLAKDLTGRPETMQEVSDRFLEIVRPKVRKPSKWDWVPAAAISGLVALVVIVATIMYLPPSLVPPHLPEGYVQAANSEKITIGKRQFHSHIERVLADKTVARFVLVPEDAELATFYILESKVTRAMFKAYLEAKPQLDAEIRQRFEKSDQPPGTAVNNLTAVEAHLCAQWLGGELPTPSQWDRAANESSVHEMQGSGVEFTREFLSDDPLQQPVPTTTTREATVTLRGGGKAMVVLVDDPRDDVTFRLVLEVPALEQ